MFTKEQLELISEALRFFSGTAPCIRLTTRDVVLSTRDRVKELQDELLINTKGRTMKQTPKRISVSGMDIEVILEALSINKASLNSNARSPEFRKAYQILWIKFGGLDL